MAEIFAETPRLLLRTEADGDRATWLAHMNGAQAMAHLGGPQSVEQVEASFERMRDSLRVTGWPFLLVALKADDTLIGKCGLLPIDTGEAPAPLRGQLQIGWTLRPDYWGQGYAGEASRAMLAYAFETREADIVFGQTSHGNAPSWRLMERLGMHRRAALDYDDPAYPARDNPTIIYAIERAQWRARTEAPLP